MPTVNLNEFWEAMAKELKAGQQQSEPSGSRMDDDHIQSSFEFTQSPSIVFVQDLHHMQPADYYDQLKHVPLTETEAKTVEAKKTQLEQNPNFYDGDQLLIKQVLFDSEANTLYLEAQKAKYSFLRAMVDRAFEQNSPIYQHSFYKVGTMVPFITLDDSVYFVERKRDGFYSAASGFLEPFGQQKQINFTNTNLVLETSKAESQEEFLDDKFEINPQITAMSIRANSKLRTLEFVAPAKVPLTQNQLYNLIQNNQAKDANEHTKNCVSVPLNSNKRTDAVKFLSRGTANYPGGFLYHPMLASAAYHNHDGTWNVMPQSLPYTRTRIIHTNQFFFKPKKSLQSIEEQQHQLDIEQSRNYINNNK